MDYLSNINLAKYRATCIQDIMVKHVSVITKEVEKQMNAVLLLSASKNHEVIEVK